LSIWYHLHGALTHFPIALAITSFVFDFCAAAFRKPSLRAAGFWCLLVAALACIPAVATGFFSANDYGTAKSLVIHRNTSIAAGVLLLVLAAWRGARRDDMSRSGFIAYLVGVLLAAGAIGLTGWLGSRVVNFL
jgi:uncharacterized membrane protein